MAGLPLFCYPKTGDACFNKGPIERFTVTLNWFSNLTHITSFTPSICQSWITVHHSSRYRGYAFEFPRWKMAAVEKGVRFVWSAKPRGIGCKIRPLSLASKILNQLAWRSRVRIIHSNLSLSAPRSLALCHAVIGNRTREVVSHGFERSVLCHLEPSNIWTFCIVSHFLWREEEDKGF